MRLGRACVVAVAVAAAAAPVCAAGPETQAVGLAGTVRLRDLGRIQGVRDNPLVGFGIVTGLAGTGDSARGLATLQSVANTLARFGVRISPDSVASSNVAAVMVTANLPAFAANGDKFDINVSSLGDASSLAGGTLVLAPLKGPDDKIYALAQGPLSVGGFRYDAFGNRVEKNHPTVGQIPNGAILEAEVPTSVVSPAGSIYFVLNSPNYVTADRVAGTLNSLFPPMPDPRIVRVRAVDAERIAVRLTPEDQAGLVDVLARIESAQIVPDETARVVINERTGTVVSGGDVRIGAVSIAQGDLKVDIKTDYAVSQPLFARGGSSGVRSFIVPQTDIKVEEPGSAAVSLPSGTSVADLVIALNRLRVSPRDVISILQAIKRADSLHAELIIQ
jgi:flagellar P-ring protein precursor FlgI